eukprot:SAG22_NODE_7464_length_736_cov_29.566719_2_plen_96_part_00
MGLELIMPGRTRRGNLAAVEYLLLHHRDDETPQLASKPVCLSTPGHRVIETRRRTTAATWQQMSEILLHNIIPGTSSDRDPALIIMTGSDPLLPR